MQPVPEQFSKPPEVSGGERRQRARHSPAALTYVTLGDSNGGIIANISETGMYVTAGEPLRENFLSRVSFRIPQSDGAVETQAEIVWTSESRKEAGARFVELREESRELIRRWVAPARRNGGRPARPAENSLGGELPAFPAPLKPTSADEHASAEPAPKSSDGVSDVVRREATSDPAPEPNPPREPERVPAAVARSIAVSEKDAVPLLAFSGLGPRAWALTAAQRAEFERLFPSENPGAAAREGARPETAPDADAELIAERFAGLAGTRFVAPGVEAPGEDFVVVAMETAAAPAPATATDPTPAPVLESGAPIPRAIFDAAPFTQPNPPAATPRTPVQSLWDAPPPMMHPIIGGSYDRGFGAAYGAPASEPLEDRRPRSKWSVAAVAILVVTGCFLLGFVVGPDGVRARPIVDAARGIVVAELSHLKSVVASGGGVSISGGGTTAAVSATAAPSGQNPPPSTPETPSSPTDAPATAAPPMDAAGSAAPAAAAPAAAAPSTTTPVADDSASDENGLSASAATDSDGARDNSDASAPAAPAPKTTERTAATATKRDLARRAAESSQAAREAQIEKERAAAAEAYAEERAAASASHEAAKPTAPAGTPETSKPAASNPAPAGAPSAAATHPAETPPRPAPTATPPQSYFPVVAPGAGNVPRLIELPEERVIDTAAVVIRSHQYVFVPAEPGPESSHALEKLQIGERVTKIAPLYPAEAAQKAMGGTVHLRAIIGKDGRVEDVRPINGPLMLITAAVDSILQWRYQPTLLEGQPIEVQEDFTVEFRPLGLH